MREALLGAERLGMAARARAHSGISQFRFVRMNEARARLEISL
jgi:hypothetical protein